jgi:AmpD protein
MRIDPELGLLDGARYTPSPNYDLRPDGMGIDVLIIHNISLPPGQFGGPGIEQLFCNTLDCRAHPFYRDLEGLTVSSHLLIRRDGEIIQFVPFHLRAWHAGQSYCEGRARVNDFSIGIELEGTDFVPFDEAQYRVLRDVTRAIMARYPAITPSRIYGHSDIAPGRKTDPGPFFDWQRYRATL